MTSVSFSIKAIAACVLIGLACFLCFTNLDKTISPSDESLHVKVIQEMYHSGQWWLPTYEGEPYFRKPPFKMWLTFIPLYVFGESNFAYRVIDASLGVLFVCLVLVFGRVMLGSFWAGWIGGFFLLFNRAFLVSSHGYRHATQDPMLHFLQFIAMWLFLVWVRRFQRADPRSAWTLAASYGLVIGVSVFTKNVLGFTAPGLAFLYLCVRGEILRFLQNYWRETALALVLAVGIPAMYMVPHFIWTPGAFENLFLSEVVERVSEGQHNTDRPWYYFEKLYRWEFIPIPFVLLGILGGAWAALLKRNPKDQYLLIWAMAPIAVMSVVPSRLLWYIAESYPAITLLVGLSIVRGVRLLGTYRNNLLVVLPGVLLSLYLGLSLSSYVPRTWRIATRIDRRIMLDRASEVLRSFPKEKILVYGPIFGWNKNYRSRVEKIYIGRFSERTHIAHSMSEFLLEAENPQYTFVIAPVQQLEEARRAIRPHSFVRLGPFHHRSQKAFLLSRIDTGSGLFEPSAPVEDK